MTMTMTKRAAASVFAIGSLVALAACGGNSGGGGGDGVITYWSQWEEDEPQASVLMDAMESFTAETGIDVDVQWQGRQVMQKVRPLLRSGDVPDLADASSNEIRATIVEPGQARDLTGVFDAEIPGEDSTVGDVLGDYESLVMADSMDGPFMLPTITMAYGMFYDGVAHAGITDSPPQTWDDFMTTLEKLRQERGTGPVAVDGDIGAYLGVWTSTALISELGEDGFNELVADESGEAWQSPEVDTALQRVAELPDMDAWAEGSFGSKFPQMQERWAAGEADLLLMGSWAPQETQNSTDENFGYRQFAFPEGSAGQFTQSDVSGFVIPAEAENAEEAEQFLAWIMREDVMTEYVTDAQQLVTRTDIEVPAAVSDMKQIVENTTVVRVYDGVDADYPGYVTEVFEPINRELMSGSITAEEMVDQITSAQADYWARQS